MGARVAIVGAGTMGGGIAMACANAGLEVRLRDASHARLHQGLATIRRNYAVSVTRGRFTEDAVAERLARIHPQLDSTGFDEVDLIIEAVFEDLALKQQVFRELDAVARPGCILATQHVDDRHRRDRVGDRRAPPTSSACTSSAPPTSCGCWRSCGARRPAPR